MGNRWPGCPGEGADGDAVYPCFASARRPDRVTPPEISRMAGVGLAALMRTASCRGGQGHVVQQHHARRRPMPRAAGPGFPPRSRQLGMGCHGAAWASTGAMPPAAAMWFSLMSTASNRNRRGGWCHRHSALAYFVPAQGPAAFFSCPRWPRGSRPPQRHRWRFGRHGAEQGQKFKAVRSAVNGAWARGLALRTPFWSGVQRPPSPTCQVMCAWGPVPDGGLRPGRPRPRPIRAPRRGPGRSGAGSTRAAVRSPWPTSSARARATSAWASSARRRRKSKRLLIGKRPNRRHGLPYTTALGGLRWTHRRRLSVFKRRHHVSNLAQIQDPPRGRDPVRAALRGLRAIDEDLLDAANLQKTSRYIWNINNGERFVTYAIRASAAAA